MCVVLAFCSATLKKFLDKAALKKKKTYYNFKIIAINITPGHKRLFLQPYQ